MVLLLLLLPAALLLQTRMRWHSICMHTQFGQKVLQALRVHLGVWRGIGCRLRAACMLQMWCWESSGETQGRSRCSSWCSMLLLL
jgi:hypothetical protein